MSQTQSSSSRRREQAMCSRFFSPKSLYNFAMSALGCSVSCLRTRLTLSVWIHVTSQTSYFIRILHSNHYLIIVYSNIHLNVKEKRGAAAAPLLRFKLKQMTPAFHR